MDKPAIPPAELERRALLAVIKETWPDLHSPKTAMPPVAPVIFSEARSFRQCLPSRVTSAATNRLVWAQPANCLRREPGQAPAAAP
jgi:hypothetical protein